MTSRKTAAKETTNAETIHSSNSPIFQYLNFSFHGHFKKENHNMKNTVWLFNAKGAWKIFGILCSYHLAPLVYPVEKSQPIR